MRVDIGGGVGDGAIARILRIEDAQRVLVEAGEAVLGQITTVRLEMRDQRRAPCLARFGVAQGVELQRHAVGDAEFVEQLIGGGARKSVVSGTSVSVSVDLGGGLII